MQYKQEKTIRTAADGIKTGRKDMKVKDLKAQLNFFDDEAEIMVGYPSGDYWGREIANEPQEPQLEEVTYSDYHRAYKVVDNAHDDTKQVVLLKV